MKVVKLLHNPGAGDEEHSKEELMSTLRANGFECRYSSTKKKNIGKDIETDIDMLVVAGGDGTVRDVVGDLLDRKMLEKNWPIGLLPLGTANNIAKTLGIEGETQDIIRSWQGAKVKKYDVGRLYDVPESKFFLESFGYGVFPYLMQEMKKTGKEKIDVPEMKIKAALELLHDIILSYEAKRCMLEIDGVDHSGNFLLAEIMNTRSIGPNLFLAPQADPGDGHLEVILVPEHDRKKLAAYVQHKINGIEEDYDFHSITGKNIRISWHGTHVHVDDEVVKLKESSEIKIELKQSLLEFLVP
ncbi:diacylglycerol kinase family protein [Chitinophagaceae bacterium LB-8]|uniref:Diacylglycerol kinase family protein n=1 Tax=Paraflavisolibacter caeni TaxID=2982496 RepID=A0A9X3B958_9BACT|nr:diacylglycerol kinase family protein [Paraflavisolibacter caeni]MCU7550671.1 diacylglycerol kinase family protein [Paraflavisolibacter caeni]